jgi:hypothetical protein
VLRFKKDHFELSSSDRSAKVIKGDPLWGDYNNVIGTAAPLINGVFEYRFRQDHRIGSLLVGWAPACFDVEARDPGTECGYFATLGTGRLRWAQRGHTLSSEWRTNWENAVDDGDIVVCRFDPRAGIISYHFPDEPRPLVAFKNVPAHPLLFPAVTYAYRTGTQFTFLA